MTAADLISPANFDFFARYFLAGFILYSVRSRYVLGERPKPTEIVFETVILSLINQLVYALLSPGVGGAFGLLPEGVTSFVARATGGKAAFFAEVLVLPTLLGVLFGVNLRGGWNTALLRRLAMPIVHPTRRAYDFAFGERIGNSFVIITFEDGGQVFGYFGQQSLAASDSGRSDIFLERLYDVDDEGEWRATQPPKSALVNLRSVRTIEFIAATAEE